MADTRPQKIGDVLKATGLLQSTRAACYNCEHWNTAADAAADYQKLPYGVGVCTRIVAGFAGPAQRAAEMHANDAALLTADTFFCARFARRRPNSEPRS